MTVKEIVSLLHADILHTGAYLDTEINAAFGSDMMSDVLAYVKDQAVLLTGLVNPQVIRTADMMDMTCIVFVRGKQPEDSIVELARDRDIVVMRSDERMYNACGKLYLAGLGRD